MELSEKRTLVERLQHSEEVASVGVLRLDERGEKDLRDDQVARDCVAGLSAKRLDGICEELEAQRAPVETKREDWQSAGEARTLTCSSEGPRPLRRGCEASREP